MCALKLRRKSGDYGTGHRTTATNQLVFEGQTLQIARRPLVATCELFLEKLNLLSTPYQVRLQVSERHFRLFLAAIEGAKMEIGMGNLLDLESLTKEFQSVELGRQVAEFISQHPHIDVIRLKSAIANLRRRLVWQDREICPLARANWAEQNSQLEALWGAIDDVAQKQRHEREKVSGLQEATG
jgi:hypothetical protein